LQNAFYFFPRPCGKFDISDVIVCRVSRKIYVSAKKDTAIYQLKLLFPGLL